MGKFWSILFLLVPVLGVAVFVLAASNTSIPWLWPFKDHWFPKDVSANGFVIDGIFNFILYLTGAIFIGTGLALFLFLWKYDAATNSQPVKYTHGSHVLEVVWSILPAATLVFIAIYQLENWANVKVEQPALLPGPDKVLGTADDTAAVQVVGRQFEWRIRYAGKDQILFTPDDLFTVNELHLPVGEQAVINITSEDVLHSFFLPNFRVKQDVVPGKRQYVWFTPVEEGAYDIVCAELCGWGHYKMKGRLIVESRTEYEAWLERLQAEQNVDVFAQQ